MAWPAWLGGGLFDLAGKILDRFPDPNERARAKEEIERLVLAVDAQARESQTEINKQEAAHKSVFVAGWRPAVGWVCAVAFGYSFVLQPFGVFLATVLAQYTGKTFDPELLPTLDMAPLMTVLMGMLGLGGLRTFEKVKGVASDSLKPQPAIVPKGKKA